VRDNSVNCSYSTCSTWYESIGVCHMLFAAFMLSVAAAVSFYAALLLAQLPLCIVVCLPSCRQQLRLCDLRLRL
jgi:hypothetical protein